MLRESAILSAIASISNAPIMLNFGFAVLLKPTIKAKLVVIAEVAPKLILLRSIFSIFVFLSFFQRFLREKLCFSGHRKSLIYLCSKKALLIISFISI